MSELKPYYVRDHRRAVANFLAALPREVAMARSVGPPDLGELARIAKIQLAVLEEYGFGTGKSLIDIGCGSGGLAQEISQRFAEAVSYLGTDIVPEVVSFARGRSCQAYRFALVEDCTIPAEAGTADFVTLFSVFTHLRRPDIRRYLNEAQRVLRPGGKLVFSYLEKRRHAKIFLYTIAMTVIGKRKIENHFTSPPEIERWAATSGFELQALLPGRIGQSIAVLRKP
jgi:ubiquinone/menaquinone biosynthesis C-methylase UbiE